MSFLLERVKSDVEWGRADCITIGIVNNMPDAALAATERQFIDLIGAAAPGTAIRFQLFYMPEVPRAAPLRAELRGHYREIATLWDKPLDGLIVTGTEPRAARLNDEPYWQTLCNLVDWARQNTVSTIWSCLAAQAAVLHVDGIERRPFPTKLFGVFDCDVVTAHPLARTGARTMRVPHSRYNNIPERMLTSCGYRVLTRSAAAGVDMFAREERRSLFLFLQGHPEYDPGTLLREYRRDIGRFLRGEREEYPPMPHGYFNEAATAAAEAFGIRARAERCASLIGALPMAFLEAGTANDWRSHAVLIYKNWIDYLKERKTTHSHASVLGTQIWPAGPMRPSGQSRPQPTPISED